MSDAIDKTGCISHRPNTHFFVMHEDFLDVAKVSEHQYKLAAFWRVLETKTNERTIYNESLIEDCKKKGQPVPETSMWIEMSYNDMARRTLGVYKASSFQIAAAESERLGFSKSRVRQRPTNPQDPKSKMTDYKEYLFLADAMQTTLNSGMYPTPVEINSPLLNSYNERKNKKAQDNTPIEINTPPVKNNTPPVDFNTAPPIENNRTPIEINNLNNINSITSKDKKDNNISNVESANADIDDTHNSPPLPGKKNGGRKRSEKKETPNETAQPTLIEIAAPTMPAEDAPWTAETLVQIVEAKREKRYEEIVRTVKGKKYRTQRERQLEAGQVIINAKFTRKEFTNAYDHRLDEWWIEHCGDLTVVDMTNKTRNGAVRIVEELEKLSKPNNRKTSSSGNQGSTVKHGQRPEDYEDSELSQTNVDRIQQRIAQVKAAKAAQRGA